MSTRHTLYPLLAALGPALLALASQLATAQPLSDPLTSDPEAPRLFTFGVSQGFSYDDNLFRVAPGTPRDHDVESITGLHLGLNHRLNRQHLFVNIGLGVHRFQDHDELNHASSSLNMGVNWATVGDLNGVVRYAQSRALADYATPGAALLTERNMEHSQLFELSARRPLTTQTAVRGSYQHRRVDFSSNAYLDREYIQHVYSVGVEHGVARALRLGVGLRYTDGRTPRYTETAPGVYRADDNKRRDIDFTAEYDPSERSTITGRISYTRDDHTAPALADFSGVTGSLVVRHALTGKTTLTGQLVRETGSETRFAEFTGSPTGRSFDANRITNSLLLGVGYQPTAKIEARGNYRVNRSKLDSPLGGSGHNTTRAFGIGVGWEVTRAMEVGCEFERERRSSNTALSSAYKFNTAYCAAQFVVL